MVQKARIAEKYISVAQRAPDQPIFSELGVSLTMRIPMNRRDNVLTATWRIIFQRGSPLLRREPRPKGMDMPTMKRKAGKTRSTKVMPLLPWKCFIHDGTILSDTPARSLTKIMVNITRPRRASIEVMRAGRTGPEARASESGAVD